ncbi:hypothetical protein [Actinoplanes rectilineatus]|uniref:hypothetical protein n=1 Tax=Actinoplanes rectilineatus TaxID=113571 RepID=UPI000A91DC64|nr:hypothetical protein [Actinoplanes rectilineatus]
MPEIKYLLAAVVALAPLVVPASQPAVSGVLLRTGGPAGTADQGIAGTVLLQAADGTITSAVADTSGRFHVTVPPGTYQVTGDRSACASEAPVVVPASGRTGIEVHCHVR